MTTHELRNLIREEVRKTIIKEVSFFKGKNLLQKSNYREYDGKVSLQDYLEYIMNETARDIQDLGAGLFWPVAITQRSVDPENKTIDYTISVNLDGIYDQVDSSIKQTFKQVPELKDFKFNVKKAKHATKLKPGN